MKTYIGVLNLLPVAQSINLLVSLALHEIVPLASFLLSVLPFQHEVREETASE